MLNEFENVQAVYATFKERALAILIDGLVLIPLAAIDWFNKSDWKSELLLMVTFIAGASYKNFFEYKYGATLGKKAMKLRVVNRGLHRVDLNEVLVRNIFDLAWRAFFFILSLVIYRNAAFSTIHSNKEFVDFSNNLLNTNPYLLMYSVLIMIEIVFVLTDKKRRSLHDRMGGTLVIKINDGRN